MKKVILTIGMMFIVILFGFGNLMAETDNWDGVPHLFLNYFIDKEPLKNDLPNIRHRDGTRDWASTIDAAWGYGDSNAEKLTAWTTMNTAICDSFACFNGLETNLWDSLYQYFTPEIQAGVSKGRFYGIVSYCLNHLNDLHTLAYDLDIVYTAVEPGLPLAQAGAWGFDNGFGAGVTVLPDSTSLVYSTVPVHPLGLAPGDIILGYDGVLWKDQYQSFVDMQFPIVSQSGSKGSRYKHAWLNSPGLNWHLFDTIDVVKYGTDDTVHLATDTMMFLNSGIFISEQMDIPGVPKPNYGAGDRATWGVIDGTEIGYIYSIGWAGNALQQFNEAINELLFNRQTKGLIIDMRTNFGGYSPPEDYLKHLFNDYLEVAGTKTRCSKFNRNDLCYANWEHPSYPTFTIDGDPTTYYDKPIAVLIGPGCISMGDFTSLLLSKHPMTKFFGKPTSGSHSGQKPSFMDDNYYFAFTLLNSYLTELPDLPLARNPFPTGHIYDDNIPFEEVWLTPDNVSQGLDDVVLAATDWIVSLDLDQDGILNENDNCPIVENEDQTDSDEDGVGDLCDNCIDDFNPEQIDTNGNNIGDICEYVCGDIDGLEGINILDIVFLVNYVYKDGPAPEPLISAEMDGISPINILDIVLLINNVYKDGPEPIC
ncbi:MAG: hypothetical protein GY865_02580 [candidate division Zixibacteria bacterium]|nr:hypothetical protein [candidate division Zixibacteria bacterium]